MIDDNPRDGNIPFTGLVEATIIFFCIFIIFLVLTVIVLFSKNNPQHEYFFKQNWRKLLGAFLFMIVLKWFFIPLFHFPLDTSSYFFYFIPIFWTAYFFVSAFVDSLKKKTLTSKMR